jgi:hypothetical protein
MWKSKLGERRSPLWCHMIRNMPFRVSPDANNSTFRIWTSKNHEQQRFSLIGSGSATSLNFYLICWHWTPKRSDTKPDTIKHMGT